MSRLYVKTGILCKGLKHPQILVFIGAESGSCQSKSSLTLRDDCTGCWLLSVRDPRGHMEKRFCLLIGWLISLNFG